MSQKVGNMSQGDGGCALRAQLKPHFNLNQI